MMKRIQKKTGGVALRVLTGFYTVWENGVTIF